MPSTERGRGEGRVRGGDKRGESKVRVNLLGVGLYPGWPDQSKVAELTVVGQRAGVIAHQGNLPGLISRDGLGTRVERIAPQDAAKEQRLLREAGMSAIRGKSGRQRRRLIEHADARGFAGTVPHDAGRSGDTGAFAVPPAPGDAPALLSRRLSAEFRSGAGRTLGPPCGRAVTDFSGRKPVITLDVGPAGKPGAFKVFYDGKPLPKAKVEIGSEFGWKRELKTDDTGAFEVELPWKGIYQVEATLMDPTPGVHGTEAYDGMRFVTTLTFKVATGLEAPPRPTVTTPKRY